MKGSSGQLMIEILVGLGVITTVLVGSLVVIIHASRLARASRNKLEATRYTEKVLESLRNTRDQDKAGFFTSQTCPACGPFGTSIVYTCVMTCDFSSPTQDNVTVTMTWDDGDTTASVTTSTVLTLYDL